MTTSTPLRRLLRLAATVVAGAAVTAGVATIAGASQGARQGDRQGAGAEVLEAEIEAMAAGGTSAHDAKVRMLEDDLAALERGRGVTPPREPGVDVAGTLAEPSARDDVVDTSDASLWDDGTVQCEVVPPDLLTAADIAGATCTSTLEPGGGSRYSAVAPDGTVRTVHFAPDGTVTREPDAHS